MNVLIIDEVHPLLLEGLQAKGVLVDYKPNCSREELIESIGVYEGLVVRTKTTIDENVLLHAEKLKWIGRAGAGLDNIDLGYCERNDIYCFNAGEANADAVGEHTLAMLLSIATKLQKADKEVRQGIWNRKENTGWELKGKTIGIIGYGNTGMAVAKKLSGFETTVLAYDKYKTNYADAYAQESTMNDLQARCDIVSLHVPLTSETSRLVTREWINGFQKPIVLLNLARGGIVDLADLCASLKSGKVVGAGLDVLENENLQLLTLNQQSIFNTLIALPQVVLSPHVGGWTEESYQKISEVLLQKINQLRLG
ncbi:MAG: phosphoglycerate dehydrogenase [Bacteroidia bacterium]|jgi:D-3-phosphoglycerate dehydrogenase|nr:phosphoglycerate dehydrogenase [Bacteroidia bacterium]